MLSSIEAYSQAIYAALDSAAFVRRHTVRIYSRGAWIGVLEGQIEFDQRLVLRVFERMDFARQRIMVYSYEVWQGQQQLYWYDPRNILPMPVWPVAFRTTSTFRLTSSTIVSPRPNSPSPVPTFPF